MHRLSTMLRLTMASEYDRGVFRFFRDRSRPGSGFPDLTVAFVQVLLFDHAALFCVAALHGA